jgi:hypothetical protein
MLSATLIKNALSWGVEFKTSKSKGYAVRPAIKFP